MPFNPSTVNQLSLVKNQADSLYAEILQLIEEIQDSQAREVLTKLVRLTQMNQELQTLSFINLLSRITENQVVIDDELMQISEYVEAVVRVHQEEARSLEKVL
jgi:hypothetical protein